MKPNYETRMAAQTRHITESHLNDARASSIGSASAAAAIVLLLLQTGVDGFALKLALYAAALAIPASVAAWQFVSAYLYYGRSSYGHFNSIGGSGLIAALSAIGLICLGVSFSAVIWHLAPVASVLFMASFLIAMALVIRHNKAVSAMADEVDHDGDASHDHTATSSGAAAAETN